MNTKLKKRLRSIGHDLKPVVTVAGNGLSDSVKAELNRALDDHELIKARIAGDKDERREVISQITEVEGITLVQSIGGIVLLYRPAREPNPALSNILRSSIL